MTDSIRPGAAPSRSRRDRVILLSIAGAVAIGAGGFLAGRASVDTSPCRAVQEIAAKESADALALTNPDPAAEKQEKAVGLRRWAALIHSRPECFPGNEREDADRITEKLGNKP